MTNLELTSKITKIIRTEKDNAANKIIEYLKTNGLLKSQKLQYRHNYQLDINEVPADAEVVVIRNNDVKVNNIVRLIDGSSLTADSNYDTDVYIIYAYPEITGLFTILKTTDAIVTKTNITSNFTEAAGDNRYYQQDIELQIGAAKFYTCSGHVTKV